MSDTKTQYNPFGGQLADLDKSFEQNSAELQKIQVDTERISAELKNPEKLKVDTFCRETELEEELDKIEEEKFDLKRLARVHRKSLLPDYQSLATPPSQQPKEQASPSCFDDITPPRSPVAPTLPTVMPLVTSLASRIRGRPNSQKEAQSPVQSVQDELKQPTINHASLSGAARSPIPSNHLGLPYSGSEDDLDDSGDDFGSEALKSPKRRRWPDHIFGVKTERGTTYLEKYSHVTRLDDGRWVELRCGICGVNSGSENNFYKGLNGFKRHFSWFHHMANLADDQVVAHCKVVRHLSTDEVDALRLGQPGAPSMRKVKASAANQTDVVLRLFPTIVKLSNGKYVELKCNVKGCDINSTNKGANETTEFKGLNGFGSHIRRSHPEEWELDVDFAAFSPRKETPHTDRILSFCSQRELTDREVEAIKQRGREAYKITCKAASYKRRRRSRTVRSPSVDESAESAGDMVSEYEDSDRGGEIKRARRSGDGFLRDSCIKSSPPASTIGVRDQITVDMSRQKPEPTQYQFEEYCACTLLGHQCETVGCTNLKFPQMPFLQSSY
ncbi:uncharacterized protein BDZ99DRAFT_540405 [Mytilinidion resinicola]|uniref:Uncharacterized protein n=1 Tax=Mytilinidion resinicola TaxID=574789 RepID=A0A6A6YB41_9PEZI|nr:uncharacterized protein BDZ99DRAFT_540405 [Mytilinidion resinicola]KAF2805723.1 hypothetical protein BDZ99DRAFT_540405 [Mytilinidion resinicola]